MIERAEANRARSGSSRRERGGAVRRALRRRPEYEQLEPVISIAFLDARTDSPWFHSIYDVLEAHEHVHFADVLAVHVIELPRVDLASTEGESPELQRWARFLRLDDERALDSLANETPIRAEAKHALEVVSRETSAQRIAELRREAEIARRLDRAEDLAQGREEGRSEGKIATLRAITAKLCRSLGIELAGARVAELESWNDAQLDAAVDWLPNERTWPPAQTPAGAR